jgi:hypothetical protein
MRTTIALALLGLTAVLASQPAATEELRLRRVNDHRLVIEGPFGGTRGYVRTTPSGRLVIENEWGRRVGSVRPLRAISIDIAGLGSNYSSILAPEAALELAHKLIAACARLRRGEGEPGAGPLSSTFWGGAP